MNNQALQRMEEPAALVPAVERMTEMLSAMAGMIRATNERMTALETEVRRLTKVTPAQAAAINAAIRQRAGEVCALHRCPGGEKQAAAAIRKGIRLAFGITSTRELPRGDYALALRQVGMWDDYEIMERIRKGVSE